MGIPGLSSGLRKYAKRVCYQGGVSARDHESIAIIDGPSLAHHLHRTITDQASVDGIVPNYNYDVLGKAVVTWLDQLVSFGFELEGIYFDGALPESKREVRRGRLQKLVDRNRDFKKQYDIIARGLKPGQPVSKRSELRPSVHLPYAPFLVFAVVEALLASPYAKRTWLVNGEADDYCAAAAVETATRHPDHGRPIVIFTSDADLCIYKFRPAAVQIATFEGLEVDETSGNHHLWLNQICVMEISSTGHAVDFVEVAYAMQSEQALYFAQALDYTRKNKQDSEDFAAFAMNFDPTRYLPALQQMVLERQQYGMLSLDSRISEPMYQLDEENDSSQLELYLPVLFEDTARAGAWKMGTTIRDVAAQLLLRASTTASCLLEYRRSGREVRPRTVDRMSSLDMETATHSLCEQLQEVLSGGRKTGPQTVSAWRTIVMRLVANQLDDIGTPQPDSSTAVDVVAGNALMSWERVHLNAQFQAMYYSLRMLQQVCIWHIHSKRDGSGLHSGLARSVSGLPGIISFFTADIHCSRPEGMGVMNGSGK